MIAKFRNVFINVLGRRPLFFPNAVQKARVDEFWTRIAKKMTNNTPPAHEPSSSDDLPASEEKDLVKSIGGYHIIELLGRGGMGVVYRAKHATQTHHVALKTLRAPEALLLTQMRTEIESLARLQHPGIVQILAHGMHDNRPWYAMDLVDGITLQELCKQLHPHMTGHSRSRFTHDSFLSIGSLLQYGSKPVEWPQPPQTSDDEKTHTVLKGSSTFGAVPGNPLEPGEQPIL